MQQVSLGAKKPSWAKNMYNQNNGVNGIMNLKILGWAKIYFCYATQQTFTCSNSATEILENDIAFLIKHISHLFLVFLLLTLNK